MRRVRKGSLAAKNAHSKHASCTATQQDTVAVRTDNQAQVPGTHTGTSATFTAPGEFVT